MGSWTADICVRNKADAESPPEAIKHARSSPQFELAIVNREPAQPQSSLKSPPIVSDPRTFLLLRFVMRPREESKVCEFLLKVANEGTFPSSVRPGAGQASGFFPVPNRSD